MKGLYKSFRQFSKAEFASLWNDAIFVFDANVLLNLYRYQSSTRDDLLKVLGHLGDRIWIPYHVGLEFERNRLSVMADQNKKFSEVNKAVHKSMTGLVTDLDNLQLTKRHSLINPEKLINGYEKLTKVFLKELDELKEKQQGLTDGDQLREKIETLFDGKVGSAPVDQEFVDSIHKEGKTRFDLKIPPGYEDSNKEKSEPDEFMSGGILYKRKYGDLVVWKQILQHSMESEIKSLIFVTDDNKEDWWQIVNSDGPKRIGPRPELYDEISQKSGVEKFYMYNPEGFLKYSKELLHAEVSEDTINEVRDISVIRAQNKRHAEFDINIARSAETAVYKWLEGQFGKLGIEINKRAFPDFIVRTENRKLGFEAKYMHSTNMLMNRLREMKYRSYFEINNNDFDELVIVFVLRDIEDLEIAAEKCLSAIMEMPSKSRIVIGLAPLDGSGNLTSFIPYEDFHKD